MADVEVRAASPSRLRHAVSQAGPARFFQFYNEERLHAALDYLTPAGAVRGVTRCPTESSEWSKSTRSRAKKQETNRYTHSDGASASAQTFEGSRGTLVPSI